MMKKAKKLWCGLLALVMLFALGYLPFHTVGVNNLALRAFDSTSVPNNLFYGRNLLLENTNELGAYDAINQGVGSRQTTIDLSTYALTEASFEKVFELYRLDHAEHYWLPNTYNYHIKSGKIKDLTLAYLTGFDENLFATASAEYLDLVYGVTSEYEIALILHDALAKNLDYVMDAGNAHNAYGAIVEKQAVCEGYAEAYQYLLQRCGIMSFLVTGSSKGEGHEWNLVRLDGNYYYTDVTWDDGNENIFHAYFNITTERLMEDHDIDDPYYVLPICDQTDKMYTGLWLTDTYDVNEIASRVNPVGRTAVVEIYFTGETDDFMSWYTSDRLREIVNLTVYRTQFNISGGYAICGREHQIFIIGQTAPAIAVSLNKTSLSMVIDNQVTLVATVTPTEYCSDVPTWTSSNPAVVTVDSNGKLRAKSVGSAVITVTAGTKTATCTVEVHNCEHLTKTLHEAKSSTCTVKGNDAYQVCDDCGAIFDLTGTLLSNGIPYLDLLPHSLSDEITWVWAEDNQSAVAQSWCSQCEEIIDVTAEVTSETVVAPTETEAGEVKYTAVVTINGETFTDTKTVTVPPVPAQFSWSKLWDAVIQFCSFNGAINGYLGFGIISVGTIAVLCLLGKMFKRH